MQHCADEIKSILANSTGNPTRKVIALLAAIGVTKTSDVAAILGITDRAVRKAKAEPEFRNRSSDERNLSSGSGTTVPEPEFRSKKEIPPTPPKEKTTLPRTTLNVQQLDAREPALGPNEKYLACKANFNGSTEWMLETLERAIASADRQMVVEWLFNTTNIHGAEFVRGAFQQVNNAMLAKNRISRLPGFISSTAASLKAKAAAAPIDALEADRLAYRRQAEAIAGCSL